MNSTFFKSVSTVGLLLIFSAIYFFNLGQAVVIDYDEGMYAQVSKEMFEAGEYLVPTLNGEAFYEKQPMTYWMQMAGYQFHGASSFGARFFNVIAAVITVLALYFTAAGPLGKKQARRASLILGSSFVFVCLARVAMSDMLLTMFFTLCLTFFWYAVERGMQSEGKGAVFFWMGCVFAALAMLTKGAIGAIFPIVTGILYLLSIRRPSLLFRVGWILPGMIILAGLGYSWYIALGVLHPNDLQLIQKLFLEHHLGRFGNGLEWQAGLFCLVALFIGMMPWFFYVLLTFRNAPIYNRELASNRFMRLFAIQSLVVLMFSFLITDKLPNSILPAIPGLALLISALFDRIDVQYSRLWTFSGLSAGLFAMLIGMVLLIQPVLLPMVPDFLGEVVLKVPALTGPIDCGWQSWVGGLLFLLSGAFIIHATQRKKPGLVFTSLLLNALCVNCVMVFLVFPIYDRLVNRPVVDLAIQASAITPEENQVLMYQINERPSALFYGERNTLYKNELEHKEIASLFERQQVVAGISTEYYVKRLQDFNVTVRTIAHDSGYVLFDVITAEGEKQ